jgi:hypothetical protein
MLISATVSLFIIGPTDKLLYDGIIERKHFFGIKLKYISTHKAAKLRTTIFNSHTFLPCIAINQNKLDNRDPGCDPKV